MKWISVKDKMPVCNTELEDCDMYMSEPVAVLCDDGTTHIATWNIEYRKGKVSNQYWFDECETDNGYWIDGHIRYWTPLPEKPKGIGYETE